MFLNLAYLRDKFVFNRSLICSRDAAIVVAGGEERLRRECEEGELCTNEVARSPSAIEKNVEVSATVREERRAETERKRERE